MQGKRRGGVGTSVVFDKRRDAAVQVLVVG